jgi:hypothetical protein
MAAIDWPDPEIPSIANTLSTSITLRLDGPCCDVPIVFQHVFDLAAVDTARGVDFRDRDLHADGMADAENGRRSREWFDIADQDFGIGETRVGRKRTSIRQIGTREQDRRGRQILDHHSLHDCRWMRRIFQ